MKPTAEELIPMITELLKNSDHFGEKVGGSGHMAFTSFSNLKVTEQNSMVHNGKPALKIGYTYDVWIEHEFEMTSENEDLFKETHKEHILYQEGKFTRIENQ